MYLLNRLAKGQRESSVCPRYLIKVFLLLNICLNAWAQDVAPVVTVESLDEQLSSQTLTVLRIRLKNESTSTLKNVKLSYFFTTEDKKEIKVDPYYLAGVKILTTKVDSLSYRLDLYIDQIAPGYFPNNSGISIGLHYTDWSEWYKQNDFSQPQTDHFAQTSKLPVYVDESLYTGITPSLLKESYEKLNIDAFTPETLDNLPAWVDIINQSLNAISMAQVVIEDHNNHQAMLGNIILPSFSILRVEFGANASCFDLDFTDGKGCITNTTLESTRFGELRIKIANEYVSYVAWGGEGRNVISAVESRLWRDQQDYIQTNSTVITNSKTYTRGSQFRKMNGREGKSSVDWLLYIPSEFILAEKGYLPLPAILSAPNNVIVSPDKGNQLALAWSSVQGANSYQVTVTRLYDELIINQQVTDKTSVKVTIPESGTYKWEVFASEFEKDDTASLIGFWPAVAAAVVGVIGAGALIYYLIDDDSWSTKSLNINPKKSRRDTKLLDVRWGDKLFEMEWDQPHLAHESFDNEESGRCWAVATHMLNEYFGGNLMQDEIKLQRTVNLSGGGDPIGGAFIHGINGGLDEFGIQQAFAYALNNTTPWLSYKWLQGTPSEDQIKDAINAKTPLAVIQVSPFDPASRHVMIVDSYRTKEGMFQAKFLNTDNNGSVEWRTMASGSLQQWMVVPKPETAVRNSDPLVSSDTDGDGITDWDEIYRFKTKIDKRDSDDDGIEDKVEVISATYRTNYYDRWNPTKIYNAHEVSDVDGDGVRAELDPDADNGGIIDGIEDLNKDGFFEEGEGDPYSPSDDYGVSIPNNWALYALNSLKMNDGMQCILGVNKSCKVGARGESDQFSVVLGARAKVGTIESNGNILLRSNSTVEGNVLTRKRVIKQYGATVLGNVWYNIGVNIFPEYYGGNIFSAIMPKMSIFPNNYMINTYATPDGELLVAKGETKILESGKHYSKVKVDAGGQLQLSEGDLYVGNLQLESSSIISFVDANYPTTLHISGSCIWRANINALDLTSFAERFTLIQHSDRLLNIEGQWAGSIIAPYSFVVIGQSEKKVYGRILGKDIEIHQYVQFHQVNLK